MASLVNPFNAETVSCPQVKLLLLGRMKVMSSVPKRHSRKKIPYADRSIKWSECDRRKSKEKKIISFSLRKTKATTTTSSTKTMKMTKATRKNKILTLERSSAIASVTILWEDLLTASSAIAAAGTKSVRMLNNLRIKTTHRRQQTKSRKITWTMKNAHRRLQARLRCVSLTYTEILMASRKRRKPLKNLLLQKQPTRASSK